MDAGFSSGFGDCDRQVERSGAEDGELAREKSDELLLVGDIDRRGRDGSVLFHLLQLFGAAVGDADAVVAGMGEHASDGGADLACSDDDDILHSFPQGMRTVCAPIVVGGVVDLKRRND
ncbi:hypothetical protein D9M70_500430 [compost metagenome]